jgi:hypothetical protein
VKRFYYETHDQLRSHLNDFIDAYNFARRLKTLKGLTSYEYVCKIWTKEPNQVQHRPNLSKRGTKHLVQQTAQSGRSGAPCRSADFTKVCDQAHWNLPLAAEARGRIDARTRSFDRQSLPLDAESH